MLTEFWQKPIPYIRAITPMECAGACLAMVLEHLGKATALEEIREVLDTVRGTSAPEILIAAKHFGLVGEAVRVDLDQLEELQRGSIMHWEFNHFVVYDRLDGDAVVIADPAIGVRRVRLEDFRKSFTGIALQFQTTPEFKPGKRQGGNAFRFIKEALIDQQLWPRILVTSLVVQLLNLALPILTGAVVQTIIPRADGTLLLIVGVGLVVTSGTFFLASLLRTHLLLHLQIRVDARMVPTLMDHVMNLPFDFFQRRSATEVLIQIGSTSAVREQLTTAVLTAVADGAFALLYLVMTIVLSPAIGLMVALAALLQGIVFAVGFGKQRYLANEQLDSEAKAFTTLFDLVRGAETIKSQGTELRSLQGWEAKQVLQGNASMRTSEFGATLDTIDKVFRMVLPLFVLGIGTVQVMEGRLDLGTMFALSVLATGFAMPFANLVTMVAGLQKLAPHFHRLDDLFNAKPEQDRSVVAPPVEVSGEIQVERVSYRYSPKAALTVKEASVSIEPGQFIGICGPSGSGKSTLAKLIVGLYSPAEGRVSYGGRELRELDRQGLRQQIGFVPQKPSFFTDTIWRNLSVFDEQVSREQIEEAARLACIHDDILAMPLGYETLLVNEAQTISGGQRQRLALARALLRKPKLLILDEATSALDAMTERLVQQQIERLACARVVIAHRLSTIQSADLILVMAAGRIVDRGTHAQLLGRCALYQGLLGTPAGAA